ncbi:hypothetical protein ID866_3983 [Astraeus odoratus]|nr:hypothetical protein ID866_3983 [Astraeus odoratus]
MTLSLASGLLYLSELIEEYSRLAKLVGQRGIYCIIAFHILLCICDSLPLPQTLFSIFCHVVYLQNFSSTWPVISLSSVSFVASCILAMTNHLMWFMHFSQVSRQARHTHTRHRGPVTEVPSFADIATFFGICVWLVPLFLFLSLSANDNALPTSGVGSSNASSDPSSQRAKSSLFKSVFGAFWKGGASKPFGPDATNGLIAPPSPAAVRQPSTPLPPSPMVVRHPSSPLPSPSGKQSPYLGPPPRSPSRRLMEDDSHSLQPIRLRQPPGRSPQSRRRATADSYSPSLTSRQSYSSQRFDDD